MNIAGLVACIAVVVLLFATVDIFIMSRHKKLTRREIELNGALAIVETSLTPNGSVLIGGELWRARAVSGTPAGRGCIARVVGASGHLLLVRLVD